MDTLTASTLLIHLKKWDIRVSVEGDHLQLDAPAGALTPELRAELADHKAELLAHLRQQDADEKPISAAGELEQATRQAQDWRDLERLLEQAQHLYEAGELKVEEVERLAVIAQQKAPTIPERAGHPAAETTLVHPPTPRMRKNL